MPTKDSRLRPGLATALARLVAVGIYGIMILVDLRRWPRDDETWLGWVLAIVAATAYVVTFIATAVLVILERKMKPQDSWTFGIGGLLIGLMVALLFDLPNLNLTRVEYYALAGSTGICTSLVYRKLLLVRAREQ